GESQPEPGEHGHVALHGQRVGHLMSRIHLRLYAQVVAPGRDGAERGGDFATEVVRLAGLLIDEREVEVRPVVIQTGADVQTDVRLVSAEFKDWRYER